MELFVNTQEPRTNLSVKCRTSTKEIFLRLCKETNLNQADFLESAILLLNNPTSANWRRWLKIHQERKIAEETADQLADQLTTKTADQLADQDFA